MTFDKGLNDFESKMIANVRQHGCQVNFVFDPEYESPSFSYSVGFHETIGQPEVIVFGLPQEIMHFMINETLRQCDAGLQLEDWGEITGLLEGHACIVRKIPPQNITAEFFSSAIWFHRYTTGENMREAFQLIWPGSEDGLFPWEEGSADIVCDLQPPLFSEHFAL